MGDGSAGCEQDQSDGPEATAVASRTVSPTVPVTVSDDPADESGTKTQIDCARKDIQAGRQRLYALFQPRDKEARGQTFGQQDPRDTPSFSSSFNGSTAKRPTRSAAARTRQTELVDYTNDVEDEFGDPSFQIASSSAHSKATRTKNNEGQPPRPLTSRSFLPPLKLNVSGTGLADGQAAHSFFQRRPGGDNRLLGRDRCGMQTKASNSQTHRVGQKPASEPPWPSHDSMHVLPAEPAHEVIATLTLPFEHKGGGKSMPSEEPIPSFHSNGLAERVRGQGLCAATRHSYHDGKKDAVDSVRSPANVLPESLSAHAAFARFGERARSCEPVIVTSTWTDRWQPHSAEEVLGNERSAGYLREWLSELRIASTSSTQVRPCDSPSKSSPVECSRSGGVRTKRRKVQTGVEKTVKTGERSSDGSLTGASFIVDELDDDFYAFFEGARPRASQQTEPDVDDLGCSFNDEIESPVGPQDSLALDFRNSERLTNCIVLCGPPGTGKTAAVFACAEELNFEVFELFPGAGRRGARELKEAVGALGRNHMVSGGGRGGGANRGSSGSFAHLGRLPQKGAAIQGNTCKTKGGQNSLRGRMLVIDSQESEDGALPYQDEDVAATEESKGAGVSTRQSLILIEEVDIVFEDDRAFWDGVKKLIAQSRRPVVLTCNDLSYVPHADLAVQQVLTFSPPPRDSTLHYLRLLSEVEGRPMTLHAVEQAIKATHQGTPAGRRDLAEEQIDLRQAIHQLHFASTLETKDTHLGTYPVDNESRPVAKDDVEGPTGDLTCLRRLYRGLSSLSFAHAELVRPFSRQSAGDEPSSLSSAHSLVQSDTTDYNKAAGHLDSHSNGGSAYSTSCASASVTDDVVIPGWAGLTLLRSSRTSTASPVALPLEGKEELLFEAVENLSLASIRKALHAASSCHALEQVMVHESDHSHVKDLYAQALYLQSMLSPLFVFDLPPPPPSLSSRPFCLEVSKLALAPDRFWVDYAPYVRLMVKIEDFEEVMRRYAQQDPTSLQEGIIGSGGGSAGRSLRTSTRLSRVVRQERIMPLTKEGLAAARASGSGFALGQFSREQDD